MIAGKVWGKTELIEANCSLEFHRIDTKKVEYVPSINTNTSSMDFMWLQVKC